MKYVKGATVVTQYCLKLKQIDEFLKEIPETFSIKELSWEWWQRGKWRNLEIPRYLISKGLKRVQECSNRAKATGSFKDMTRTEILAMIKKFSQKYDLGMANFIIRRITITNGDEKAVFKYARKQIKLPNDRRRKMVTLGLVSKTSDKILERLSVQKIACQFIKSEKNLIVCSEVL
jgi:hypothetical protein